MKSKLLPIILFLLIVLNGVLIFMLINKTHENKQPRPERNFLTEKLNFTNSQKEQFMQFDNMHRERMQEIEQSIMKYKDELFNSFQKEGYNIDSLSTKIGLLEGKKDVEIFNFFGKVRSLCTKEQVLKFDKIIKQALKGGQNRPPREGMNHPRRDGEMPPPPPR
ncbi:MAG: hypothetical protein ABJH82_08110 [Polaribacter sp.]|uniref:Spy/CpxP family protein refolding chaperone n=1 Tax=Polaribacter sp. TaxID=1920175 RepID=UPI003263ED24